MSARYTGREERMGDRDDNLAVDYRSLESRVMLAMSNLVRRGKDERATEDLRLFIAENPSEWGNRTLAVLDAVPPYSIWEDIWEALYGVRVDMTNARTGYIPS